MKYWEYRAVTYDASVYCIGCLPAGVELEDDSVAAVFADSEWDSYPICDCCHTVHDYVGLTDDGRQYEGIND